MTNIFDSISDFILSLSTLLIEEKKEFLPLHLYSTFIKRILRDQDTPGSKELIDFQEKIFVDFCKSNKDFIFTKNSSKIENIEMNKNIYIDLKKILTFSPDESDTIWTHLQTIACTISPELSKQILIAEDKESDPLEMLNKFFPEGSPIGNMFKKIMNSPAISQLTNDIKEELSKGELDGNDLSQMIPHLLSNFSKK